MKGDKALKGVIAQVKSRPSNKQPSSRNQKAWSGMHPQYTVYHHYMRHPNKT